jgi:hypothetical protein
VRTTRQIECSREQIPRLKVHNRAHAEWDSLVRFAVKLRRPVIRVEDIVGKSEGAKSEDLPARGGPPTMNIRRSGI